MAADRGRSTWSLAAMDEITAYWPYREAPPPGISIYDTPEEYLAEYQAAPLALRTVHSAYWLQSEVLNGGLAQFFGNDSGVAAPEAADACRTVGLPRLAGKLEEAMSWFGSPYPRERTIRESALAGYAKSNDEASPFEGLDEDVVALLYDEGPGLEAASLRWVESNRS